jgi:hypothetical protein
MSSRSRPYKKASLLVKDIEKFLIKHATTFGLQGSRISHYFEMGCYNDVVKFYEKNGFTVSPQNLKGTQFHYKISAHGDPDNFSHFAVSKALGDKVYEFEIHHNLSLECPYESEIFYTADISVINKGSIVRTRPETYAKKRSFCRGFNLQTFFEVKHISPFPELLFSFVGLPENILMNENRNPEVRHLAPSLLMSGRANFHGEKIRKYLEGKYNVNIIFNIFGTPSVIYSSTYPKKKIGTVDTTFAPHHPRSIQCT